MPVHKAPEGGVTINGQFYAGGQFIPGDVVNSMTEEERAQLDEEKDGEDDDEEEDDEEEEFTAQSYFDSYYDNENPEERAKDFLDKIDDGILTFDDVTGDYVEMVADDLIQYTRDPADYGNWAENYDGLANSELMKNITSRIVTPPEPFNPTNRDYVLLSKKKYIESGGENWDDIINLAKFVGSPWQSQDNGLIIADITDSDSLTFFDYADFDTDKAEYSREIQDVARAFYQEQPNPAVRPEDVPQSAKNLGRVSGSLDQSNITDFNPFDVDVYKPVSKDWYVLRRGRFNSDRVDDSDLSVYDFVHRRDIKMLERLPPQYFEKDHAIPPEYMDVEDDAIRKRQRQEQTDAPRERELVDSVKAEKKEYGDALNLYDQARKHYQSVINHADRLASLVAKVGDIDTEAFNDASSNLFKPLHKTNPYDINDIQRYKVDASDYLKQSDDKDEYYSNLEDYIESLSSSSSLILDAVREHEVENEHQELLDSYDMIVSGLESYAESNPDLAPILADIKKMQARAKRLKNPFSNL